MPVLTKINTNVIADDAITAAKTAPSAEEESGGLGLSTAAAGNLTGTISTQQLQLADAFTLTGDLTVNDDLILGKVRDDGTGQSITGSGKTLTGTGTLTMGSYLEEPLRAEKLGGELGDAVTIGSVVTGSPALNLGNFTGVLPVEVTGGSGLTLVNRPCFKVTGDDSTSTSMATGTEVLINFPTVVYDPDSYYTAGTDRWTPTNGTAKYYYVYGMGGVGTGNDYDNGQVNIRKNGSTVARIDISNKETNNFLVSTIVQLDGVDDYIEFYMRHNAGSTKVSITAHYQIQFGAFAISG